MWSYSAMYGCRSGNFGEGRVAFKLVFCRVSIKVLEVLLFVPKRIGGALQTPCG